MSNAYIVSIVGGRDQETKLDLKCYDFKWWKTLSNNDKSICVSGDYQTILSLISQRKEHYVPGRKESVKKHTSEKNTLPMIKSKLRFNKQLINLLTHA